MRIGLLICGRRLCFLCRGTGVLTLLIFILNMAVLEAARWRRRLMLFILFGVMIYLLGELARLRLF